LCGNGLLNERVVWLRQNSYFIKDNGNGKEWQKAVYLGNNGKTQNLSLNKYGKLDIDDRGDFIYESGSPEHLWAKERETSETYTLQEIKLEHSSLQLVLYPYEAYVNPASGPRNIHVPLMEGTLGIIGQGYFSYLWSDLRFVTTQNNSKELRVIFPYASVIARQDLIAPKKDLPA